MPSGTANVAFFVALLASMLMLGPALAGAQALFWTYTQPANLATANWTVQPDDWERLRREWEYLHLAGAVLQLLGMACLVVAALSRRTVNRAAAR